MSKKPRRSAFAPNLRSSLGYDLPEAPQAKVGVPWLSLFGFELGEEVLIFPNAAAGMGSALQGTLVDIAVNPNDNSPSVVVIRQPDKPRCVIPWASIMMITKAEGPRVEVPQPEVSMADLVAFAEGQGIEIPDEVRAQAAIENLDDFVGLVSDDIDDEFASMVVTNTEIGGTDFDVLSQF